MISLSVFTISSLSKASEERGNVTRGSFATSPTHQMLSSAQARALGTSRWDRQTHRFGRKALHLPRDEARPSSARATGLCGSAPAWDVACSDQYHPCTAVLTAQAQEGISSRAPALGERLEQCSSTELTDRQGSVCSVLAASGHCPHGDEGTAALNFPTEPGDGSKSPCCSNRAGPLGGRVCRAAAQLVPSLKEGHGAAGSRDSARPDLSGLDSAAPKTNLFLCSLL